jgi:hypothetical protein
VKGLELISICCGLFNPSRALGPYLLDFLHMHTKLSSDECRDEKVARVRVCLYRLTSWPSLTPLRCVSYGTLWL